MAANSVEYAQRSRHSWWTFYLMNRVISGFPGKLFRTCPEAHLSHGRQQHAIHRILDTLCKVRQLFVVLAMCSESCHRDG
eukprot:1158797-Pelagomonas_calceolata.AAC.4